MSHKPQVDYGSTGMKQQSRQLRTSEFSVRWRSSGNFLPTTLCTRILERILNEYEGRARGRMERPKVQSAVTDSACRCIPFLAPLSTDNARGARVSTRERSNRRGGDSTPKGRATRAHPRALFSAREKFSGIAKQRAVGSFHAAFG